MEYVRCVAAPILQRAWRAGGGLSVSGPPSAYVRGEQVRHTQAVDKVTAATGGVRPRLRPNGPITLGVYTPSSCGPVDLCHQRGSSPNRAASIAAVTLSTAPRSPGLHQHEAV
jgi:hypothetical protein